MKELENYHFWGVFSRAQFYLKATRESGPLSRDLAQNIKGCFCPVGAIKALNKIDIRSSDRLGLYNLLTNSFEDPVKRFIAFLLLGYILLHCFLRCWTLRIFCLLLPACFAASLEFSLELVDLDYQSGAVFPLGDRSLGLALVLPVIKQVELIFNFWMGGNVHMHWSMSS